MILAGPRVTGSRNRTRLTVHSGCVRAARPGRRSASHAPDAPGTSCMGGAAEEAAPLGGLAAGEARLPALRRARRLGRATLDSVPIRACSGRGLPRRRSPGSRAWALTPRFHPCLCLHSGRLSRPEPHRPSAVWFLLRFPSGRPGSPLATSLPCGARTFLPRTLPPAGDPPSASGRRETSQFEGLREPPADSHATRWMPEEVSIE